MRVPLGRGWKANWRKQGPNFGPILPSSTTRPKAVNMAQIGIARRSGGSRNRRIFRHKEGLIIWWFNGNILGRDWGCLRGRDTITGTGPSRS